MAFPTAVNSQVTDSVAQANTKVTGDSPAVSVGELYIATSQALSNAAHNATANSQQSGVTNQASTTQGLGLLYSLDPASAGKATRAIEKAHRHHHDQSAPIIVPPVFG